MLWTLGIAISVGNLAYWSWVAQRGEPLLRAYCERRFAVRISFGARGAWRVSKTQDTRGSVWWIEWLLLPAYLAAFTLWAVVMGAFVWVMGLMQ